MDKKKMARQILSAILVIVMVAASIANEVPKQAQAAVSSKELASTYLSASEKTLYLGEKGKDAYNFNIKKDAGKKGNAYYWYINTDKGNNDSVKINKRTGVVTAKKAGVAYIRCKVTLVSGNVLRPEAKVTVKNNITEAGEGDAIKVDSSKGTATVSTEEQLNKALAEKSITQITIVTKEALTFTIAKGDYSKKTLIVDAANADMENYGTFKEITIKAIKNNTWIEYADGNIVYLNDDVASFVIEEGAQVKRIVIDRPSATLNLVIKGTVEQIMVTQPSTLNITGSGGQVPVTVADTAGGSTITTSMPLKLELEAKAEIKLNSGAEETILDKSKNTIEVMVENNTKKDLTITTDNKAGETIEAGKSVLSGETTKPTPTVIPASSSGTPTSPTTTALTGITISTPGNVTTVVKGKTLQLRAAAVPANATNQTVVWSIDEYYEGMGTIDSTTGLLTTIYSGYIVVIATNVATGISATIEIVIEQPEIYSNSFITDANSNPTVIIAGTNFKSDIATTDLTVDVGTTGLILDRVRYVNSSQIIVSFTGLAATGKVSIEAKPSAFNTTESSESNIISFYVTILPSITSVAIGEIQHLVGRQVLASVTYSTGNVYPINTYQWLIASSVDDKYSPIEGATNNSYYLGVEEEGKYIKVTVTGGADVKGTATSAAALVLPSDNAGLKSITVKGKGYLEYSLPAYSVLGELSGYGTMYITPAQAEGSDITEFVPYYNGTTKVVKYLSGADISNFETDTQYADQVISNGNKFIIKVTSANGIKIRYYWLQVLIANATLSATSNIKGQAIQDFGTTASTIEGIASVTPGAIAISTVQVNGSFSTVFQETDIYNAKVKAVKYAASADISGFETDTAYNDEIISNNDFFIVRVIALDNITVNYYKIIVSVK